MNFPILQVEDSEEDIFFLRRAFQQAQVSQPLHVVRNGENAIEYLSGTGQFSDRLQHPPPCLVLLDLKLPGISGLEVLEWIREQPQFQSLVVLVLTSSANPSDVETAYNLGANSYLVKPFDLGEMVQMIKAIKSFWLTHNIPPPTCKKSPEPVAK